MTRAIPFFLYTITSLLLGFFTYQSMMWAMYGAPVSPLLPVALLGAIILFCGGVASLANPAGGRITALVGIAGLGVMWIPAIVELVPNLHTIVSPVAYVLFGLYFFTCGFALLFPTRWRWSVPTVLVVLGTVGAIFLGTLVHRASYGLYDEPTFVFLRWYPNGEKAGAWLDADVQSALDAAGIKGTVDYCGGSGIGGKHTVYILAAEPPRESLDIHYPRGRVSVYAFDGKKWLISPQNGPSFPAFATIEPTNSGVFLSQDVAGGRQSSLAFHW